jgi:BASS family bile acid:Na+ symporter
MPTIGYLLTVIFNLPPDLAVGVILVGCCPGGTASNVITFLAGGDLALSVGITSVSTLLAPIVTPLLVWLLAGTMVNVNVVTMFISIVQVVILPIAIGIIIRHYAASFADKVAAYLPAFSVIAIALIVSAVVAANQVALLNSGITILIVVILHNILGFICGYGAASLCRMARPKRVAVSIEVGMQNSGLACSLANQHFAAMAMAGVPGAIFSVWHNLSGALFSALCSRKII